MQSQRVCFWRWNPVQVSAVDGVAATVTADLWSRHIINPSAWNKPVMGKQPGVNNQHTGLAPIFSPLTRLTSNWHLLLALRTDFLKSWCLTTRVPSDSTVRPQSPLVCQRYTFDSASLYLYCCLTCLLSFPLLVQSQVYLDAAVIHLLCCDVFPSLTLDPFWSCTLSQQFTFPGKNTRKYMKVLSWWCS